MTKQLQIELLESRAKTLEARGPRNNRLVNKIRRRIRQLNRAE